MAVIAPNAIAWHTSCIKRVLRALINYLETQEAINKSRVDYNEVNMMFHELTTHYNAANQLGDDVLWAYYDSITEALYLAAGNVMLIKDELLEMLHHI